MLLTSLVELFFSVHGAVPNHIPPWLDLITREVCGYRYAIRDALLRAGLLRLLYLEAPMG